MTLHKSIPLGSHHVPYNWEYANAAAREGASGFANADKGKLARQLDDNSLWMLVDTTPEWSPIVGQARDGYVSSSGASDGYVAYFTGSDTLSGSPNLFWNSSTGRLGIGTDAPDTTLHVDGDGYYDGYLMPYTDNMWGLGTPDLRWRDLYVGPESLHIISKSTDGGRPNKTFKWEIDSNGKLNLTDAGSVVATFDSETGAEFPSGGGFDSTALEQQVTWIQEDLDGYNVSSSGVSGAVQFSNGSGGFSSDDANFHWDNGNDRLGIGTNSPQDDLHIVSSTPTIRLEDSDGGDVFSIDNTSGSIGIRNVTDSNRFDFTVDGDGKIGINTTDPEAYLHVYGSLYNSCILERVSDDPWSPVIYFQKARDSSGSLVKDDYIGGITYSAWNGSTWGAIGTIRLRADGNQSGSNVPGRFEFISQDASGQFHSRIVSLSSGYVGIETDTPHETLTVNGVVSLKEQASYTNTHDGYGSIWAKDDGKLYYTDDLGTDYDLTAGGSGSGTGDVTKVGTPANNQVGVWTGDGTIEGDANFTWDGTDLTVNGNTTVNDDLIVEGAIANVELQAALDSYGGGGDTSELEQQVTWIQESLDGYDVSSSGVSGAVQFSNGSGGFTSDDANFHWDNSNDRLGIGTNSPSSKLHIVSDNEGPDTLWLDRYTSEPDIVSRRASGSLLSPSAVNTGDLLFHIGARGYHSGAAFATDNSASINFVADDDFTTSALGAYISFSTIDAGSNTETEKMRLTSDGYLAVGTETPSSKLHVVGNYDGEISAIVTNEFSGEAYYAASSIVAESDQPNIKMVAYASEHEGANLAGINRSGMVAITANDSAGSLMFNIPGENFIYFANNDTVRMSIDDQGNVGIGVEEESNDKLHIYDSGDNNVTVRVTSDNDGEDASASVYLEADEAGAIFAAYSSGAEGDIAGYDKANMVAVDATGAEALMFNIADEGSICFANNDDAQLVIDENSDTHIYNNLTVYEDLIVEGAIANVELQTALDAYGGASDISLKKDIVPLENVLDDVMKLNGVKFHWKEDRRGTEEQMGFIAQEVEKIYPDLVLTKDTKSIKYHQITALLVESIKELKNENNELRERLLTLENKFDKI